MPSQMKTKEEEWKASLAEAKAAAARGGSEAAPRGVDRARVEELEMSVATSKMHIAQVEEEKEGLKCSLEAYKAKSDAMRGKLEERIKLDR